MPRAREGARHSGGYCVGHGHWQDRYIARQRYPDAPLGLLLGRVDFSNLFVSLTDRHFDSVGAGQVRGSGDAQLQCVPERSNQFSHRGVCDSSARATSEPTEASAYFRPCWPRPARMEVLLLIDRAAGDALPALDYGSDRRMAPQQETKGAIHNPASSGCSCRAESPLGAGSAVTWGLSMDVTSPSTRARERRLTSSLPSWRPSPAWRSRP